MARRKCDQYGGMGIAVRPSCATSIAIEPTATRVLSSLDYMANNPIVQFVLRSCQLDARDEAWQIQALLSDEPL